MSDKTITGRGCQRIWLRALGMKRPGPTTEDELNRAWERTSDQQRQAWDALATALTGERNGA